MKNVFLFIFLFISFIINASAKEKFEYGDKVRYNSMEFYVMSVNDNYLTLYKDKPIASQEARNFLSSTELFDKINLESEYLSMQYQYSEDCKSAGFITTGCSNDYQISAVKQVVDAWANHNFNVADLVNDKYGYKYRIVNSDEVLNALSFEYLIMNATKELYYRTANTPYWAYGYDAWGMGNISDNEKNVLSISKYGSILENYPFSEKNVRPVVNIKSDKVELLTQKKDAKEYKMASKINCKTGDIINYNNQKFYVLRDSSIDSDSVNLIKATPLSVEEVEKYGTGYINKFTQISVLQVYNNKGYGGVAYYSSENCGYKDIKNPKNDDCKNDYESSDIKHIVDNWVTDNFKSEDLSLDEYGYTSRVLNDTDLFSYLHYENSNQDITIGGEYLKYTESTPRFNLSSCWTMIGLQDYNSFVAVRGVDGNFYTNYVYYYGGTICPVVTVKKQDLVVEKTTDNEVVNVPNTKKNNLISYIIVGTGVLLIIIITLIFIKIVKKEGFYEHKE